MTAHPKAQPGTKTLTRRELANAIRALSMDAVQKANSGHPGAPMGMADIAEVLWNDFLKHNPANPKWPDRDRFVLSNGHGSMLLYSLLHLTGYDLSIEDLKNFRQWHSKTPGHPEYGYAPGIETTTGPLGQGITNAVGMALAEKILAAHFNRPGFDIVDHYTYVFLGDGCMMEGISHEACSLAGHLKLGKLIAFYDDNGISIDGHVVGWFTDDSVKRFESYGWHVIPDVDGHSAEAVKNAIVHARSVTDRPTLICCKTIIGFGSPNKQGKEVCHGAALGADEVAAARKQLGWNYDAFVVPQEIYDAWTARAKGAAAEKAWNDKFGAYKKQYPELALDFERRMKGELPAHWGTKVKEYVDATAAKGETIATRKASQNALNAIGPALPELLGGSADLAESNLTLWKGCKGVTPDDANGNYIYYGVREFGMTAMMNGLALHGGFIPYGGTFLVFSDYARNAVRMAALMKIRSILVYSHDSIGLGEDGPTHQPVEHVASLRYIPNMALWRPCDAVETAVAWKAAVERKDGPTSLILTRQNVPHQNRDAATLANIARGGYVLSEAPNGKPEAVIIATGSEVGLAMEAQKALAAKGRNVRVVSMPCTSVFEAQDAAYRDSVLPTTLRKRVAVEAGVTDYWRKYVGLDGRVVGIDRFGESAPGGAVMKQFGFTAENVVKTVEEIL
ncbi:transketolase [Sulfurifustis variabilis]|uniref:Transketolase n=1 Tax=Sulfurifustis variabilis TaxID=1675686 RepID=A0A1B4VD03_9GAMM|nr:transketolase [Sulfurifustis variabilis]BAU50021.1 transketolase [Sulfurifustis variabilis]